MSYDKRYRPRDDFGRVGLRCTTGGAAPPNARNTVNSYGPAGFHLSQLSSAVQVAHPPLIEKHRPGAALAITLQRRKESKQQHRKVTGTAIRSNYLLGGLMCCGLCGGRLIGQTCVSGKGYRTRYYICATHHRGDHAQCPKRYKVPADLIERHIVELIKSDLANLRDDEQLHRYVEQELARVTGGQGDARERLQRRLVELDQQVAKLRDHFRQLDPETAKALGVYEDAKRLADERGAVEQELSNLPAKIPALATTGDLRERARAAFEDLDGVLAGGTIEERRELLGLYVEKIKADPDIHSVLISLYPALFSRKVAGGGFEPPTSGL